VFAAQIGITNAQLVATNLLLANELLTLAQQMQETANTANETRNLLGDSNTTARLNETKAALVEASKVAADVRSVMTSSNLAAIKITSADRTINSEQEAKLISILKPWTQANLMLKKSVEVDVEMSDFEAIQYGNRITGVLKECGFDANMDKTVTMFNPDAPIPSGVEFWINGFRPPQFAVEIITAFKGVGIPITSLNINTNAASSGTLIIKVWHNPK
jgi:hypothetical protein